MNMLRSVSSLVILGAGANAFAGGPPADVKAAMRAREKTTFYLKTNVPHMQGAALGWVSYKRPLVTCVPATGVQIEGSGEFQGGAFHAEGRRLSLRVNDAVRVDEFDWDDDDGSLDVEIEGTGRSKGEGIVQFREIRSAADFQTCWNGAFSEVSIEQKYDWPEDVKRALVAREVKEGMTPEQVLVAVGTPERVSREVQNGQKVEIWTIQRGQGTGFGIFVATFGDKREGLIRFVDGKVAAFDAGFQEPTVKLK